MRIEHACGREVPRHTSVHIQIYTHTLAETVGDGAVVETRLPIARSDLGLGQSGCPDPDFSWFC